MLCLNDSYGLEELRNGSVQERFRHKRRHNSSRRFCSDPRFLGIIIAFLRRWLGHNLVPDYITHVQNGGFCGWPWWHMGGHQDPRHEGKHPELKDKVITPDVILHPHNA